MAGKEAASSRAEITRCFLAMRQQPGNARCAECHSKDTSWVVLNYGVLVCVQCAGAHRGLGTHISTVRSTQHDQFTASEIEWIESLGNAKNASLHEGSVPPTMRRPSPDSPDVVRRTWLRLKYDEQRFTQGNEHFAEVLSHERQSGFLQKQGSVFPTWKRRFFVVQGEGQVLCYYSDASGSDASLRGALPLAGCSVHTDPEEPLALKLRYATPGAKSGGQGGGGQGGGGQGGGGQGGGQGGGSGGGSGSGVSMMALRAPSVEAAEAWAWALFQCSHGAVVRAAAAGPQAAAAAAAALPAVKRRTLFSRGSVRRPPSSARVVTVVEASSASEQSMPV